MTDYGKALRQLWLHLNKTKFQEQLRPIGIVVTNEKSTNGSYHEQPREIRMSEHFLASQTQKVVSAILAHEMAHQYVAEVLKVKDETSHGPAFQSVCKRFHVEVKAKGIPSEEYTSEDRISQKIKKLLALAGSANKNEAENAARAAHRLLMKHNQEELSVATEDDYVARTVGTPKAKLWAKDRWLSHILTHHFQVSSVYEPGFTNKMTKHRQLVLEICGRPENVELASYVHDFLVQTADRLWSDYHKETGVSGRYRRAFEEGIFQGFNQKLNVSKAEIQAEGLILEKDACLIDWMEKRHPWLKGNSKKFGACGSSAWGVVHDGTKKGQGVVLHRGVGDGPSSTTKLLTG